MSQLIKGQKDLLFIVPDQFYARYKRIIRHTIWATRSEKTCDILSCDQFSQIYGELSVEDAIAKLRTKYVEVGNTGDLSKREQSAYNKIIDACQKYAMETP